MRTSLAMHEYCEPIAGWAWLAAVVVCAVSGLAARRLWKPSPDSELSRSDAVWRRILNNVIAGTALAISAVSTLYGSCGWFGRACWAGGFCEAAWKGPPWILVSGIAAAPAAVLLWHWRTVQRAVDQKHRESELRNAKNAVLSRELAEAAKILNDAHESARVAGVYAVTAVAKEDPENYALVGIHVLESYVAAVSRKLIDAIPDELGHPERPPFSVGSAVRCAWILGCAIKRPVRLDQAVLDGLNLRSVTVPERSSFNGACMTHIAADGVIMPHAILNGADMRNATLRGARLEHSLLKRANMGGCNLGSADLRGVVASDADLSGAILAGAQLEGAILCRAGLRGAHLADTDLSAVELTEATYDDDTQFPVGFDPVVRGMVRVTS